MNYEDINHIYNRLESISVKIEPKIIPNPRYISEKLGECHVCIDEVERYYIRVSKELSFLTRALNNAEVRYQTKKDELIVTDPTISSLPSLKDREACANTRLKDLLDEIRNYKNQILDLNVLNAAILMKLKILNRANNDIKTQLRLMESQIKLGSGTVDDSSTKSLMDEIKKSIIGKDILEGAESKDEEMKTVDPSGPLSKDDLSLEENKINNDLNIVKINNNKEDNEALLALETKVKNLSGTDNDKSKKELMSGSVDLDEDLCNPANVCVTEEENMLPDEDPLAVTGLSGNIQEIDLKLDEPKSDLNIDSILDKIGGESHKEKEPKETAGQKTKKSEQTSQNNSDQIDFAALLSQFS